ncbi:MAG TPA: DUF3352 domain-containing protein [Solirubrobacteraceae bacterium]|nr:DUF3352 domain-containing protein [Solirubrobacteraceae bacterium]
MPVQATPTFPRSPRTALARRAVAVASSFALLVLLAGCGSSHSTGTTLDPATLVPASAPLYAGADVRPAGSERAGALAAGSQITHQADPYARLVAVLQTPGSPALQYARDVAPWLGPRAGIFLTSEAGAEALLPLIEQGLLGSGSGAAFPFANGKTDGAVVLDTSDLAKARSFVEGQAAHAGAQHASYRGVSYERSSGGVAFAIVKRFAVLGSEAGVRAVIDTAAGGPSLRAEPGYARLAAAAPAGALAHLFTNPAAGGATASQVASSPLALLAGAREANISILARSGAVDIYADTRSSAASGSPGGLLTSGVEGGRTLDQLPGGSWLALGLGNLGHTLGADVAGLRGLVGLVSGGPEAAGSSAISLGSLVEGLLTPLAVIGSESAQARAAFTSWMGSGGVFAGGASVFELKGAIVIESRSPAKSRAAVGALAAALARAGDSSKPLSIPGTDAAVEAHIKGLPVSLDIADGRDASGGTLFVLGLGEASVTEALHPSSTMVSSASRSAAAGTLGEGIAPSLIFEVPALLGLLEGVGLTEDPTFKQLAPFAKTITTVTGGGHPLGGEVERYKLSIALRGGG